MKKFINDVEQAENEMILGLVKAYPDYLRKLDCPLVEGAVAGTIAAAGGLTMEAIYKNLTDSGYVNKF